MVLNLFYFESKIIFNIFLTAKVLTIINSNVC